MENFKFNVSIILNAVELIKNNFEVKEEVKNFFLGTKQYIDLISDYMAEQGIMEEYVDLFNWTDPEIIFEKYILVHEDAVKFDYAAANREDSLSADRANIFFSVPCEFEIDKYIKVMDQGTDDSSEKPASNINGWELTDDSCFQYSKKLYTENGEERWAFIEMVSIGDKFRVHADALKLSSYDNEHIETCIKLFYEGGHSQVEKEYPYDWQQIALECIFETDWDGYNQIAEEDVSSEAEAYETIKRWLSDEGVVSSYCRTDVQSYESRKAKEETEKKDDDKILVEVYKETVSPELAGDTSIGHIEVEKNLLFKWFKEVILPDYRSGSDTSEGLSDEAIFEDWLLEYLPEATVGLCSWLQEHEVSATKMLGIKDIEWYIPEGMEAPKADGPDGTFCIEAPSMEKFNTDEKYTRRVLTDLMWKYGYAPITFSYMRPDNRMAGYRNWDFSSADSKGNRKIAAKELANIYFEKYGTAYAIEAWSADLLFRERSHLYASDVNSIIEKAFREHNEKVSKESSDIENADDWQVIYLTYASIGEPQIQKAYISETAKDFDLELPDGEVLAKVLIQKRNFKSYEAAFADAKKYCRQEDILKRMSGGGWFKV